MNTPKILLIFSALITNKNLGGQVVVDKNNPLVRLNQFLSTIHSMSSINFSYSLFYLEFDGLAREDEILCRNYVKKLFPNSQIFDHRLEYYSHWNTLSGRISKDINLILLQTNFDHFYCLQNNDIFESFCLEVFHSGKRAIGEISHWPESLKAIQMPWVIKQGRKINLNSFQAEASHVIGTTIVTSALFLEWWKTDFTSGERIIRPDNPFGPSVNFPPAKYLVPKIEFFRHMDGYGHVFIKNPYASSFYGCCQLTNNQIEHSDIIKYFNLTKKDYRNLPYLNFFELDKKDNYKNYLKSLYNAFQVASSAEINFSTLKIIGAYKNNLNSKDYLITICKLMLSKYFYRYLPSYLLTLTLGNLIRKIYFKRDEPNVSLPNSLLLSNILTYGWQNFLPIYLKRRLNEFINLFPQSLRRFVKNLILKLK
jgi:hypothetical protein